jgi:hypothetical protein
MSEWHHQMRPHHDTAISKHSYRVGHLDGVKALRLTDTDTDISPAYRFAKPFCFHACEGSTPVFSPLISIPVKSPNLNGHETGDGVDHQIISQEVIIRIARHHDRLGTDRNHAAGLSSQSMPAEHEKPASLIPDWGVRA